MKIEKLHIQGFRNFDDEEINFQDKTLIIGENDIGKTNLLFALRLLFDKSLNENDLELTDKDYNVYSNSNKITITVTISNITEDCLKSILGKYIEDDKVIIQYMNTKSGDYRIRIGFNLNTLEDVNGRPYIKYLNMEYVNTNRDLHSFIKRERNQMLDIAKTRREDETIKKDKEKIENIQRDLDGINDSINTLSYVSTALDQVNNELVQLSVQNEDQVVRFIAGSSQAENLLENLNLAYSTEEKLLFLGGDGRKNQIFLATWTTKQIINKSIDHVTFYAIEEPEAHLHPHQQRKLSKYIQNQLNGQVIITSHSPHIASHFNPENLIRLYIEEKLTHAACSGCSPKLKEAFHNFGYRLNEISSETFFSSGVFLVEGDSEVLFYRALAEALKIDLDFYNISIISVGGVGFKPYIALFNALNIPWVLRTDNDISEKTKSSIKYHYFSGISRVIGILKQLTNSDNEVLKFWNEHQHENEWIDSLDPSLEAQELNTKIKKKVIPYGLYLSNLDLENDLAQSPLKETLLKHYSKNSVKNLVKEMQRRKAENMLTFLSENHEKLILLKEDEISTPLKVLKEKVEERVRPSFMFYG